MKGRIAFVVALAALASLLLGGAAWALRDRFEWREEDRWVGYSGEARTNDFLAAQRLLQRAGRPARAFRGIPAGRQLPPPSDVLLIPRRTVRLSPGQAAELKAWIERGGLLITEGLGVEEAAAEETRDTLFAALGARMVPAPPEPEPQAAPGGGSDPTEGVLEFRVNEEGVRVAFGTGAVLLDLQGAASGEAGDAAGARVLELPHGQGSAILFTSLACLTNGNLANHDHADLLLALMRHRDAAATTWIVTHEHAPSLWAFLKQKAWRVLAALAALSLLGFWAAAPRFGPPIPEPEPSRRSLLEHLAATGRFLWRHRDGQRLLRATREALFHRLHRVHPGWASLPPDELCQRLAAHTGLPEPDVFHALRYDRHPDPRDFTRAIRTLDHMRTQL